MKKLTVLIVLIMLFGGACGAQEVVLVEQDIDIKKCTQAEYIEATADIEAEWLDAVELANSTSRMNLPDRISEMQSILRDYKRVEVAECYQGIHDSFILSYETMIEGFMMFMSQESDNKVSATFEAANEHFERGLKWLWELPTE